MALVCTSFLNTLFFGVCFFFPHDLHWCFCTVTQSSIKLNAVYGRNTSFDSALKETIVGNNINLLDVGAIILVADVDVMETD